MPASTTTRHLVATLGATRRHHPEKDTAELRRELRAQQLADYVSAAVSEAPPLTAAQRDRIAVLLGAA